MTTNAATVGDNLPPPGLTMAGQEKFEEHDKRVSDLIEDATAWDGMKSLTKEQEDNLGSFLKAVTTEEKAIDTTRLAQNGEHRKAIKAIDGTFAPLTRALGEIKTMLQPRLQAIIAARRKAKEKAERAAEAEAERKRKAAEEAKKATAKKGASVAERVAAQNAEADAQEAEAEATRVANGKVQLKGDLGGAASARTTWYAEWDTKDPKALNKAIIHYAARSELKDLLKRFASADARGGEREIPGFKVLSKETIV